MSAGSCMVLGCDVPVSKPGFSFCYPHWKGSRDGLVNQCEECGEWTESKYPRCRTCFYASKGDNGGAKLPALTATVLGKQLNLSAQKVNLVLAELGWMEKEPRTGLGWVPTRHGKKLGAKARTSQSGTPYVMWPESLAENAVLKATLKEMFPSPHEDEESHGIGSEIQGDEASFRKRFPARYRATDGHQVRSRAEYMIDDWLYIHGIVHAYERRLPIEEEAYCDFYIPLGAKTYVEFWGMEEMEAYRERMAEKKRLYETHGLNLVEIVDSDLDSLDDVLPRKLLKFGIKVMN